VDNPSAGGDVDRQVTPRALDRELIEAAFCAAEAPDGQAGSPASGVRSAQHKASPASALLGNQAGRSEPVSLPGQDTASSLRDGKDCGAESSSTRVESAARHCKKEPGRREGDDNLSPRPACGQGQAGGVGCKTTEPGGGR
jgi:hypothetical protein